MGKLQINLLNTSFSIKANEDDEYLNKLLGYYSNIIEEIQNSAMMQNNLQISILAGIMLCDELYKEKSKNSITSNSSDDEAEKRTQLMLKKLEEALK